MAKFTSRILYSFIPEGTSTSTMSSLTFPTIALAIGEFKDILPLSNADSYSLTI
jgi:hypothetical protein